MSSSARRSSGAPSRSRFIWARSRRKTIGQLCYLTFYIFAALATLAKGLLGFALPGAIALFYLISTREWRRMLEFEIPRGIITFIAVGVPWYAAMLILHGKKYFDRFFIHDHFKRLGSGVHQIDTGTVEHFIHWLGYGLFPWVAFVPIVFLRIGSGRGLMLRDDRSRATLLLALWATFAFTLFSVSSTKFHHYIFPVVPPLALLIALTLSDLLSGKMKRFGALALLVGLGVVVVGVDVTNNPQHWKNLFTYKYDRVWIDHVPVFVANIFGEPRTVYGAELNEGFKNMALFTTILASMGALCFLFKQRIARYLGFGALFGAAVALTVWGLNVYMPSISPTWSQRGLWIAYWDDCTKVDPPPDADPKKIWCEESSLVYKITWRGEHYYSQNESIPILDDKDLDYFLSPDVNGSTPFYIMVDRQNYCSGHKNFGRFCSNSDNSSLVKKIRQYYQSHHKEFPDDFAPNKLDHELIWSENLKFVMVKFYPVGKPAPAEPIDTRTGQR